MNASVFVGTSVDGFIARPHGELDFLPQGGGEPHGYNEFIATVDVIVIGRKTFERSSVFRDGPTATRRWLCSVLALLIFPLCQEPESSKCLDFRRRSSCNYRPENSSTHTSTAETQSCVFCGLVSFNASRSHEYPY
jgi:hypothetical protein